MKDYLEYVQIKSIDDLISEIKKIENMIRNSYEYKSWVKSIHENLNIHNCDYFKSWSDDDIDTEVHHIITLYDIVIIVGTKMISELSGGQYLLTFDIAKQVMLEHLSNRIPCILVSKTIHQAIHSGLYQPKSDSKSLNMGEYLEFVKEYKEFMTSSDILNLEKYLDDESKKELETTYGEEINTTEVRSEQV